MEQENVRTFRPFKYPKTLTENQFFSVDISTHETYMTKDLAASGLTSMDIRSYVGNIAIPQKATAGYVIPYFNLDGTFITDGEGVLRMWRAKHEFPPFVDGPKYLQPTKDDLAKYGLPTSIPYMNPISLDIQGPVLAICEGEKKSVSFSKHVGIASIGIGGCEMWKDPGKAKEDVHPWILSVLEARKPEKIVIIPDEDLWRYNICRAYGGLASALIRRGYKVELVNPPGKIDDLILKWGNASAGQFALLPRVDVLDLVQSRKSLAKTYNLAVEMSGKDGQTETVQQHTSNVTKLLENHPAFPLIWRNLDSGSVMVGDKDAVGDVTEMELANHFQHNFQFNKVNSAQLLGCVRALASKNANSPMLEWVKNQMWDGKARLSTWMQRLWGVEDSAYIQEVATKFLVGSVARMMEPGCKMDWMMVVVGKQGVGKTSMPKVLFRKNDVILSTDNSDKDFQMILHAGLCIIVDEVDKFSRADTATWKSRLTDTVDYYRPPYGATVGKHPRRSVFYGTTNMHDFLMHDPSGYRRYAPVEVKGLLEFKALEEELGQLWAEAWTYYNDGNVDWCNIKSEPDGDYAAPNTNEEAVDQFMETYCTNKENVHYDKEKRGYIYRMKEILEAMGMERHLGSPGVTREIANILTHRGVKKIRIPRSKIRDGGGRYGWLIED